MYSTYICRTVHKVHTYCKSVQYIHKYIHTVHDIQYIHTPYSQVIPAVLKVRMNGQLASFRPSGLRRACSRLGEDAAWGRTWLPSSLPGLAIIDAEV